MQRGVKWIGGRLNQNSDLQDARIAARQYAIQLEAARGGKDAYFLFRRTPPRSLRTRSTVAVERPANLATSAILALRAMGGALSTRLPRRGSLIENHQIASVEPGAEALWNAAKAKP